MRPLSQQQNQSLLFSILLHKGDYYDKMKETAMITIPDSAGYCHGKEYLAATESAFDEVSRSDTMVTERDRYYIKISEKKTILRERVEKAAADGEKIGEAQGRKAEQRDIAANMLSMDIDIHTISRATGLSEDEIRSLQ